MAVIVMPVTFRLGCLYRRTGVGLFLTLHNGTARAMFVNRIIVLAGIVLLSGACFADDDIDVDRLSARELLALLPTGQEFPAPRQVELARIAVSKVREEGLDELASTACLAMSMALYGNAQQRDALGVINECLPESSGSEPNVYLRLRSLRAGLWLLNGEPERSLAEYEKLIAEDHSNVNEVTLLRLRSNYAGALMENGQVLGAIEQMQSVIREGMAIDHDFTVLGNANNLVVLLIEQRMYNDAMAWIDRIRPVIDRSDSHYFVASLRVHEMQLLTYLGKPEESVAQLHDFIANSRTTSVLAEGSAYEFLSEALREVGDYEAAREAAETAVSLLAPVPLEAADARFSLIRTLIAQGNYVDAQQELRIVANEPLLSPIRQEQMLRLEVEVELARSGESDLLAKYRTLNERREARERTIVEQNSRYFDLKVEALDQAEEIRRIDASREVLALRTAASESAASESAAVAEAARKQQIFTLAIVVLTAAIIVLFGFGIAQRRFDRQLRERQLELNNQLTVQVEEKTNALKQQLQEQTELERVVADKAQSEALGQLTGNVAHDFNNLLQVMSIANENLANLEKTNFQASLLEGSNRALDHAKSIIRQLLSYARRQTLAEETFSISDYLDNTITLLSAAIDARVNFDVDDQSDGAVLSVDRSQLTTAILNLLSNSCDAMPDGGNLSLRVGRSRCSKGGECVMLSVKDDGMGMTEDQLERAFEPFFTTKAEDYGTGLGLSSVRGFVEQSGGEIDISSAPGEGARVTLKFPLASGQAASDQQASTQRSGMNGLSVLLVEDNPILAKALEAMIVHLGASVEHQPSGDQAARRLDDQHRFDIVISDVRMPGKLDGFALAKWTHVKHPELPVLLMSGYNESVDDEQTVMSKPFTQADLLQHVQALVA